MTILPSEWQTTDDEERPVPVRAANEARPVQPARRTPAAVTGIALVVFIGFTLFQGVRGLTGQAGQSAPTADIIVSATGVTPATFTAQPGSTVTWLNQDSIPHILSSSTVPFDTSAVFPGNTVSVTIPQTASLGDHQYVSKTSPSITGTLTIGGMPPAAPVDYTPPVIPPSTEPAPAFQPVAASSSSLAAAPVSTVVIPTNPHTVGNGEVPLPPRQTGLPVAEVTNHRPVSQPATGPGLWIVSFLSLGALLVLTRKSFVRG